MSVKVPIRTVFDGSTATGLAEYQSGEFIGLTHGGTGASLSIGSAGQVLKVNSGGSALEFGSVEAIVNIDNATNLTSNTLSTSDQILVSDGGTEGRATLSQVATAILAAPTITGTAVMADLDISGDVDVDGTLEADAITVNGATLTETITDLVGGMVSSNTETGITVTFQDADNTLDFALGAAQTTITSLLATDIKIGEDDQTKIDFETADEIHFYAANAEQVFVSDGVFGPQTDSDVDLGTTGVRWKDAYIDTITTTGNVTVGGDLTITGDDLVMGTNTSGHILVADGTNFNPIAVTDLSEISSVASGDTLLAVDASGGGLKKITRSTLVSGLATSSAISNLSEDSTPQLGGDLDVQTNSIVSTSNRNIAITPNGSGVVDLDGTEVSDGLIELKTGTGSVAKVKFYCESGNAHAQTLQAQPHSAASSAVLVLPTASGTLIGTGDTGTLPLVALDIDGGTDINAALVDADLIIVDDGAGGTNRKATLSRVATYIEGGISGDITISSGTAAIGSGVIVNADVNASAAIDATKIHDGSISNTEFGHLNGVSSNIQTQLDAKTTLTAASADATALSIALG